MLEIFGKNGLIKKIKINNNLPVLRSNDVCSNNPPMINMADIESVTLAACTRVKKSGNLKSPNAPLIPKKTPAISKMLLIISRAFMPHLLINCYSTGAVYSKNLRTATIPMKLISA